MALSLQKSVLGILGVGLGLLLLTAVGLAGVGEKPAEAPRGQDKTVRAVNALLTAKWQQKGLKPSEKTSDPEFIRRASLDLIGRIASAEEVHTFEADLHPEKRVQFVDRLLASDEYARHWANVWTGWLLPGPVRQPLQREQLRTWLTGQLARNTSHTDLTERLLTASGRTTENGAVQFLLGNLGNPVPAKDRVEDEGQFRMELATWRTVRVFLGYRIRCIQCHDHPYNPDLKQKQFWGINAFFRQVERVGRERPAEHPPVFQLRDNPTFNKRGFVFCERRNGMFVPCEPTFLDDRKIPEGSKLTRREELARLITSHDNFSRAFVNRMCGQLLGRSLTTLPAVDDFGAHNPEAFPELLDRLARDFTSAGQDPKQLIRWICASQAYQLRSSANATNADPETTPFFSRPQPKLLTARQRLDSLLTAIRANVVMTRDEQQKFRDEWLAAVTLPEVPDEVDYNLCYEPGPLDTRFEAAVILIYNKQIHAALCNKDHGTVARALKAGSTGRTLDELYLSALNRHPTAKEAAWAEQELERVSKDPRGNDPVAWWQDLFFGLLNCSEFTLNQ